MFRAPVVYRRLFCLGLLMVAPRPAAAFVGFESVPLAQMSLQLAELLATMRELLANARATLQAARSSAQLASESMRAVKDFDDFLAAPNKLFGFRAEDFADRLRGAHTEAMGKLSLARGDRADVRSALHDPALPRPLHALSAKVSDVHGRAIEQLQKQVSYAQQSGDRLLDQLRTRGLDTIEATRSQARSAMLNAATAAEAALSLAQIERRQDVQQALVVEDQVVQLEARGREVLGMGVAVGRAAREVARDVKRGVAPRGGHDARR